MSSDNALTYLQNYAPMLPQTGNDAHKYFESNTKLIVVFKQHRFYKQLCVELYKAGSTKSNKIKNPLTLINPLDLVWQTNEPNELKFFSGIARFQNNATLQRSPADIDALKAILHNPLKLDFYIHDAEISTAVVTASLSHVSAGSEVNEGTIYVNKKDGAYTVDFQLNIAGKYQSLSVLQVKYDYLVAVESTLHLLANYPLVNAVQSLKAFVQSPGMNEAALQDFKTQVLSNLQDKIAVVYTFINQATNDQMEAGDLQKPPQKLIYLSDLDNYILIDPVMQYGNIEIPIRTKRQIYCKDKKGELFMVARNGPAEDAFTAMLLQQHPHFAEQLEYELPYFYLHRHRFLDDEWFLQAFDQWQQQGITILGFNKLKGNKLNANKANINIRVTSGTNWFNTDISVRFAKKRVRLKQLQQAVRNKSKFIQLDDGTMGILPAEWLEKFSTYFNAGEIIHELVVIPKVNYNAVSKLFDQEFLDQEVLHELELYRNAIDTANPIAEVKVPAALKGKLRSYQKQGLNWLNFLDDLNFGGCLADDMGLGKSIQIIAFILLQRQKRKDNTNLLVVPTSLLFNWKAEVEKFASSIKIFTVNGAVRPIDLDGLKAYEIVLVSYGTLLSLVNELKAFCFNYIFLDESQNIKNIDSQRYQSVCLLQSRNKVAITGTPIENNVFDLYAQLSFACPGLLGSRQHFRDIYSIPIDRFKNSKRAKELQHKIAPFILRRTKSEVAKELPGKTEMVLYCEMEPAQRKLYDAYEKEFREYISSNTDEDITKNSMHVLKGITRLRQICNSPLLLEDEKEYDETSTKIEVLMEQIENKSAHHKILIFSQFVTMLDLIRKALLAHNIEHEYLTGRTKDREKVVNNFQENRDTRVFLISLKAGGTGLNLTEADYVYLVDPWWNPAVENQAIDRSHRIGQQKNVVAIRLICPNTIEEKIIKLQEQKRELSKDLVKTGDALHPLFTKAELLSLVT